MFNTCLHFLFHFLTHAGFWETETLWLPEFEIGTVKTWKNSTEGKESLVSTACACAKISRNPDILTIW